MNQNVTAPIIFWALTDGGGRSEPEMMSVLGPAELVRAAGYRFEKRRKEWLLGRWAAKQLLILVWQEIVPDSPCSLPEIEVVNEPDGAPYFQSTHGRLPAALSISHREGIAAVAVSQGTRIGIDLERIEPRSPGFQADYFTPTEVSGLTRYSDKDQQLMVNVIWSAKEAVLKLVGRGLREDTRSVEIRPEEFAAAEGWNTGSFRSVLAQNGGGLFVWQVREQFVITLAWEGTEPATVVQRVIS